MGSALRDPNFDGHVLLAEGQADREFFDWSAGQCAVVDGFLGRAADLQEDVAALEDRVCGQRQALVGRGGRGGGDGQRVAAQALGQFPALREERGGVAVIAHAQQDDVERPGEGGEVRFRRWLAGHERLLTLVYE